MTPGSGQSLESLSAGECIVTVTLAALEFGISNKTLN